MKITCTRQNASEEINGIAFERQKDGSVVATGVSADDAALFADFEGFAVEDEKEPAVVNPPVADPIVPAPADVEPAETLPAESEAVVDAAPVDVAPVVDAPVDAVQAQADAKPAKRK